MNKRGGILVFAGLFWSAITLLFDYQMGVSAVRQVLALRFANTQGTILSSEVTEHDGDEGPTYGVKLRYSFEVGERHFNGERYRYDTSTSSGGWAQRVVQKHPPGATVTIYYDPGDPENCVLRPGIAGSDLFHLVFMTPFNVVMLGFWWFGWNRIRYRWCQPIAGGVKLRTNLRKTRAQMTEYSPLTVGVLTIALLAFGSIFVVGFAFGGFHPSLQTMTVTWSIILTGGLAAAIWRGAKIAGGRYDLVLDEMNRTLQLPRTCGRTSAESIPFVDVYGAFVATFEKSVSEGGTSCTYIPTLRLGDRDGPTENLAEWHDAERARQFVAWLNAKLGRVLPP